MIFSKYGCSRTDKPYLTRVSTLSLLSQDKYLEYLWNDTRSRTKLIAFSFSSSLWKYCFKFLREESIRKGGKLAQLLLSARCVVPPVSFETETPKRNAYHFHDFFASVGLSFSIVGSIKSEQRTAQLSATVYATSWAKREERGKFIWNCAVVPSLRGQSCSLWKTIRLSRSCYRLITTSYQRRSISQPHGHVRRVTHDVATRRYMHHIEFSMWTRTTTRRNPLKISPCCNQFIQNVKKRWESSTRERNQRTNRFVFMNNKKVGEESTSEQFCVYELFN